MKIKKNRLPIKAAISAAFVIVACALSIMSFSAFAGDDRLSTDKTTYEYGEPIMVSSSGEGLDWVGIYHSDDPIPDYVSIRWYYVSESGSYTDDTRDIRQAKTNRTEYTDIPPGEYTIYLFADDGYELIDSVDITVVESSGSSGTEGDEEMQKTVKTDKTEYIEGEPILVTATGEGLDWVGLYLPTDTLEDDQSIRWYYVARDGNTSGSQKDIRTAEGTNASRAEYADVPPGDYIIYLCENDKWGVIDRVEITVKEDPALSEAPAAPQEVAYERTAEKVGLADGTLKITAADGTLPKSYVAYWADENGPLEDYTAFAPINCDGKTTEYTMVKNTLIPAEADRIIVYSDNGRTVSEDYATAMLPSGCNDYEFTDELYELWVMSDIHINRENSHIHNQHFAQALGQIMAISPDSIGIFINGDIADHGTREEYAAFNDLIEAAGEELPEVFCAIGNHDLAQGPYVRQLDWFLRGTNSDEDLDKPYFDRWINGVHFIFLGSEKEGLNAELSEEQLSWFEETLAEDRDKDRPIYVFLHQGIINTVAGTKDYQKWHGVNQTAQFKAILKDYPEVILFTGHSHWEMDSVDSMKERDDSLPTIFNTASVAYLWNDDSVSIEGAQGYFITAYEDMIIVRGRDFANGKWISSAQFFTDYSTLPDEEPEGPEEDPSDDQTTGTSDNDQTPEAPSTSGQGGQSDVTTVPSGESTTPSENEPSTGSLGTGGIIAVIAGGVAIAGGVCAAVILWIRKKKK